MEFITRLHGAGLWELNDQRCGVGQAGACRRGASGCTDHAQGTPALHGGTTSWRRAWANWITLARFPLLGACLAILYLGSPPLRLAGAALLFFGLLLDTVDGAVARARSETSLMGSVLDIAADRTYELLLWVSFAYLGLVPAVIPLIVLTRTTLTDALRSVGVAEGTAPFDQHRARLARFLVASPWMRTGYSSAKVGSFCGLAVAHALLGFPADTGFRGIAPALLAAANAAAWFAVLFCVVRGVPVVVEGLRRNRSEARRIH